MPVHSNATGMMPTYAVTALYLLGRDNQAGQALSPNSYVHTAIPFSLVTSYLG